MTIDLQRTLLTAWTDLGRHPARVRRFRTQPVPREILLDAYAALRAGDDAPCLLLRAEGLPDSLFEVGGMRLAVDRDDDGPFLVLSLEDAGRADLFTTVCADALIASGDDQTTALARFLERLDAWRRFLRERHTGLSREETVGLIGELLVLERLVGTDPALLDSWKAPDDGLHDFERAGHGLEVKTGIGASTVIHVSSLDQLDSAGMGRLDLVHVRLVEDLSGRTLGDILAALDAMFGDEGRRRQFANGLLRRGLMPDDEIARSRPMVRSRSLEAYLVGETFPRLTRNLVPMGITEATYGLDLRAITAHAVDIDATFALFAERAD
ncbi:hypothetical protein GCM10010203_47360 [Actinomadura yumaensis]